MNEKKFIILSCILSLLLVIGCAITVNIVRGRDAEIANLKLQRDGRSELIVDLESRLGGVEQRLSLARRSIEESLQSFEDDLTRASNRTERYLRDKEILAAIGTAISNFTGTKDILTKE